MLKITLAFAALLAGQSVESQQLSAAQSLTYADLADLALAAPVVAHLRVRDADRLPAELAPTTPPGHRRFLIEADVVALIRAPGLVSDRLSYVVDLPNDRDGRPARPRRRDEVLVLARLAPNRPGELQLIAPDAHIPYSAATADRLREILREAVAPDAPPQVTGVGRAFHVPGSLPGESETQIFLQTADNRPISLIVLRRPGEQPRWSVALGEIVDEAARPPAPNSLLWYRLACGLPRALPRQSLEADRDQARAIAADYRLVLEALGRCARNRSD